MNDRGVSFAALGMINCLGDNPEQIWSRLLAGDQNFFGLNSGLVPDRQVLVGAVTAELEPLPEKYAEAPVRTAQLAISAYRQIESEVKRAISNYGAERVGLVIGTSTSGIPVGEAAFRAHRLEGSFPNDYLYALQEPGAISTILADLIGLLGPAYTISTACSSGARALCSARNLLEAGVCDAVICGGSDGLARLSVNGFCALELLSPSICNPFSLNRNGITIGEGACLFLLTRDQGGVRLLGIGESSDAYHFSAPDPEGVAVTAAIRQALDQAALRPDQISYVNLHGTATIQNDAMESRVIERLLGLEVPCSSTKPLVGHTLGAAGAIEAGFCVMALATAANTIELPPHCWDGVADPALASLNLISSAQTLPAQGQHAFLSNSFAFGGNNCVVAIGRDFD